VLVRLQVQDLAENVGEARKEVPAADGGGAAAPTPVGAAAGQPDPPPGAPGGNSVSNWTPAAPPDAPPGPPHPPAKLVPDSPDSPPAAPAPVAVSKQGATTAAGYSPTTPGAPGPLPPPAPDAGPPVRGGLPPVQLVNHKQVKLEFDVGKFGPSGLGGVDVYVTTDDGATWTKSPAEGGAALPLPPDAKGGVPVRGAVTVQLNKEDVTYGFYLVVKSKAGLGKAPPKPGDLPQIRVEVDVTPPDAELYSPQPDPARRNTVVLSWKASDKNLAANPVSLEYATNKEGPWESVGEHELPNTGRYTWQVPESMPPSVYLRLTVRDTAGNKAVAVTGEPVLIDLSVPEITNIGLGGGADAPH
jgi:hypothetical protein